jgi:hypothetical protein
VANGVADTAYDYTHGSPGEIFGRVSGDVVLVGLTRGAGRVGGGGRMLTRPRGQLVDYARQIREGGHPIAASRRTIAVGEDAQGNLFAGSSNGFDKGMKSKAAELGVMPVRSDSNLHAEEDLLREVPDLTRVGTSKRTPCGPSEHNCEAQLRARGIDIDND